MADKSAKEMELEKRLREAEDIIKALRSHKVDAVVGTSEISMLRLKHVEDQLQEQTRISANRLNEIETIYQNVPVGLCTLDTDLRLVRVNDYLAGMNGIPAGEHPGKTLQEVRPHLTETMETELRQLLRTGKSRMDIESSVESPAGNKRYWLEHWVPLYDQHEKIIGINMVVEDITRRKRSEEELQQLNATLEERVDERTRIAEHRAEKLREMAMQMSQIEEKERQRLARVLHDGLQQLLIGAKFNMQLLMKRLKGKAVIREQFDQLNEILDQSIAASRSLSYELSPPILHDHGLIAALQWLADLPHLKGLNIDIEPGGEVPALSQSLKVFLFHSVRELLINIIKHAEADHATIRISYDDKHLFIEVIDEGKGFDATRLNEGEFRSLGLRNIYEKLELMNGQLKVRSEPGLGSHFTLCVPLAGTDVASKPLDPDLKQEDIRRSSRTQSSGNVHADMNAIAVLVVDDHQVMRNGLVQLLAAEPDIEIVGEASNGQEAVEFVQNYRPDVIIMDISMPVMDGVEATRLVHRHYPEVHVIGLSMHLEGEYLRLMKEAGATDLLNKGGPAEKLLSAIRSVNN